MTDARKTSPVSPLLFVHAPNPVQMRNPLNAEWNLSLGSLQEKAPRPTGALDLADLIDFSQMNVIFQNFLEVIGLPQTIINFEGRVLTSSHWQRLCMEFHRAAPLTLRRCIESDTRLSREMQEGKPYAIYRCPNGLTDAAAPIIIEGLHVANLFIGQFLLAPPDLEYFATQCEEFGFDKESYMAALAEVPIVSEEKLPAILNMLTGLARQIALQSLSEHRAQEAYANVERQVNERTAELHASAHLLRHVTSQVPGMVYQFRLRADGSSCLPYASEGIRDIFGVSPEDVVDDASKAFSVVHPEDIEAMFVSIQKSAQTQTPWHHEFRVKCGDGTMLWALGNSRPARESEGSTLWHGFITDVTRRKQAEAESLRLIEQLTNANDELKSLNVKLEQTKGQLLQSEKMAAIGQLAAGVAHEINNPIGFINANLGALKRQADDLLHVIDAYELAEPALAGNAELMATISQAKATADLDFVQQDMTNLINESLDGVHRVKKIVDNLKDFSRVDTAEWQHVNLENGLESTLNIVWNELKYKAEVRKTYAGLPEIECIASQLNQVFMNLLVNAAHAIAERGVITLRTGFDANAVWVEIEDDGVGIPPEDLKRIFEPFFTTKPVGKGTGLGLSLAYGIVQLHQGALDVRSEPGQGTTFRVTLPRERVKTEDTA